MVSQTRLSSGLTQLTSIQHFHPFCLSVSKTLIFHLIKVFPFVNDNVWVDEDEDSTTVCVSLQVSPVSHLCSV